MGLKARQQVLSRFFASASAPRPEPAPPASAPVPSDESPAPARAKSPSRPRKRPRSAADHDSPLHAFGRGAERPVPRDEDRRERFANRLGSVEPPRSSSSPTPAATALTPLEAQVDAIRRRNRGTVHMVECGYKFRFFGEDADVARTVCHLYTHVDHNFLTASVPTHRLMVYVRRLVRAGHRVGVVRQTETAALKRASANPSSQPFSRKLTELYTPGTLPADPQIEPDVGDSAAAYILAVDESAPGTFAVVAVELATGDVVYDHFSDPSLHELEARLEGLAPVEVLMHGGTCTEDTQRVVTSYAASRSPPARVETISGAENANLPPALASMAPECTRSMQIVTKYLSEFNLAAALGSHATVTAWRFTEKKRKMCLDAATLRNFHLLPAPSEKDVATPTMTLFQLLNRTKSRAGARLLRKWILQPLVGADAIRERLDSVEEVEQLLRENHPEETGTLAQLIHMLSATPDFDKGLSGIIYRRSSPRDVGSLVMGWSKVAEVTRLMSRRGNFRSDLLQRLFNGVVDPIPVLRSSLGKYLDFAALECDENFSAKVSEVFTIKPESCESAVDTHVLKLFKWREDLADKEKQLGGHLSEIRTLLKAPSLQWKTVAQEEFLVEIPPANLRIVPKTWTRINQTKAFIRFRTDRTSQLLDELNIIREKIDLTANYAWKELLGQVAERAHDLRHLSRFLDTVDCIQALSCVARFPGYVRPEILDASSSEPTGIHLVQARHPLVELAPGTSSVFVPNDVSLGLAADHERCVILTGPNMGGKSTLIRMAATIAIMAQIGSFVPATTARVRPFDAVLSRMGASDNIARGSSTFETELSEASSILKSATRRSLVVMDELGRGTSTHDGAAIAHATLEHLAGTVQCCTLFVTHYPLVAELRECWADRIGAYFMDYAEDDASHGSDSSECASSKRITFLYRTAPGVADRSYGLNVASLAGLPDEVLATAARMSESLERSTRASALNTVLMSAQRGAESAALLRDLQRGRLRL